MKSGLAILIVSLVILSGYKSQNVTCTPMSKDNTSEATEVSESEEVSQKEIKEPITQIANSSEMVKSPQKEDITVAETIPQIAETQLTNEESSWWQSGLQKDKIISKTDEQSYYEQTSELILYDDVRKISYINSGTAFLRNEDFDKYNELELLSSAKEADDLGERILKDNFFEIVVLDDTKYTIVFYEKGIELTQSLPNMGEGLSVKLSLDKDDYSIILENIKKRVDKTIEIRKRPCGCVQWLSMMRKSSIADIAVTSSDGNTFKDFGSFEDLNNEEKYIIEDINPLVYNVRTTNEKSLPNSAKIEITFDNGFKFEVYTNQKNLLIYDNELDKSLIYDLNSDSEMKMLNKYAQGELNLRAGKPVIYLYPKEKTDCTVKVGYPNLTYTYPTYNNGWNVTAYPDGKLINKSDNTEHYYLFWEGNKRIDWKYDSGFVVKGSETEDFLKEKLAYMGLTTREYNDFITYWVPKLKNAPYNLITFAGEQYENLAPLTVTPTPDSILRVHMVFKSLNKPIEIKEQELKPFTREGFTVVEWGGTDDN